MANFNFNKVILGGRLTSDPELKQTPTGVLVTSFSIAVTRKGKEAGSDFFTCMAWRNTAEFISKYFKKGNSICIVGTLQNRSWTDPQSGQKRYATDIVVDEANFVDSRSETPGNTASVPTNAPAAAPMAAPETPRFEELSNDDDLPF